MINVLIRCSRPKEFRHCMETVREQTHKNIRVIASLDDQRYESAIRKILQKSRLDHDLILVHRTGKAYGWNLYCNELKARVTEGWFFYLDDDDCLSDPYCLSIISHQLSEDHGIMCQFLRKNKPKPEINEAFWMKPDDIVRGRIGGSCIFLHHTHKDLGQWDDERAADYRFIKQVSERLPLKFIPHVVVKALNNGRHGK